MITATHYLGMCYGGDWMGVIQVIKHKNLGLINRCHGYELKKPCTSTTAHNTRHATQWVSSDFQINLILSIKLIKSMKTFHALTQWSWKLSAAMWVFDTTLLHWLGIFYIEKREHLCVSHKCKLGSSCFSGYQEAWNQLISACSEWGDWKPSKHQSCCCCCCCFDLFY